MSDSVKSPASGLKDSASRALGSTLGLLHSRLELASLELAQERERLYVRLGLLFAAVLLMVFGVLGLGVLIALYFWETQRMAAVLAPTILCICAGFLLFQKSKTMGKTDALPFAATLAQFDKDRAAFNPGNSPLTSALPKERSL